MADNDMTMMSEHHQDEDFSGRRVSWWAVADSTFERCKFESLRVKGAELGGGTTPSVFIDCSFDGSRLNGANLGYLRFERCTFRNVMLKRWICHHVDFVDCVFSGNLDEFTLFGSLDGQANEIRRNDLRDATMLGGGFRAGVDLYDQQLPADPRHLFIPDPAQALRAAYEVVMAWEDGKTKNRAASTLEILAEDYRSGQPQLLLCPKDNNAVGVAANERLRDLVRKLVDAQ